MTNNGEKDLLKESENYKTVNALIEIMQKSISALIENRQKIVNALIEI